MKRLLLLPYTFVLLNWAAVKALYCFLSKSGLESLWPGPSAAAPGPGRHRALRPSKP
jgi:hypothetical protein